MCLGSRCLCGSGGTWNTILGEGLSSPWRVWRRHGGMAKRRVVLFLYRADEAIPVLVEGLNVTLRLPIISDCPAYGHQAGVQGPIAHELVGPEVLEQFILRDHTVTMGSRRRDLERRKTPRWTPIAT